MQTLSNEAAVAVLARNRIGRLGCFSPADGRVYVVPLLYVYREGSLYAVSVEGQKLRYLREHPTGVCVEVDEVDDERNWRSVVVTGRFELATARERLWEGANVLFRAAAGPLRFALADGDILREPEAAVLWALRVDEVTGRSERWDFAEGYRYW